MSGICGWSNNQLNLELAASTLDSMASELQINPEHAIKVAVAEYASLATVGLSTNNEIYSNEAFCVAIQGHVHWLDDELARASINQGLAQTIVNAYIRTNIDFLKKLSGNFALCLIDLSKRKTLIAIDKIGISSLFFSVAHNQLVFASDARAITKHPHTNTAINPQAIFDYLYFHMVPSPRCIFDNVEKLLPGEYVLFEDNNVKRGHYWQVDYSKIQDGTLSEQQNKFLEILEASVSRSANETKTGAFLSGGTDSSSIAGMYRKIKKQPIDTFSIGFEAEGFDETEYARIAAKHFDTTPHEYYLKPQDVVDAIPLIAKAYDEPFGNASAVPTFFCAQLAQLNGMNTLLAGDGGDEIFGGNERYAKQKVFELYHKVPRFLRNAIIEPLLVSSPLSDKLWPLAKAKSYVNQANIPLPDRLETYNFLKRIPLTDIFDDGFLSSISPDEPAALLREIYHSANSTSSLNKMLFLDLKFTLADSDLRKVNRMCELAKMEVRYPFLDEEFIDFTAQLPEHLKLKGFKLRYFFKHALRDFLPKEILTKQKHGFGLPFGVWMNTYQPLKELAHDSTLALSKRGIIKPSFINSIHQGHQEHPSYYGVFIWVLMMLEQWFQHNS